MIKKPSVPPKVENSRQQNINSLAFGRLHGGTKHKYKLMVKWLKFELYNDINILNLDLNMMTAAKQ